jgi:hypothetical protein
MATQTITPGSTYKNVNGTSLVTVKEVTDEYVLYQYQSEVKPQKLTVRHFLAYFVKV